MHIVEERKQSRISYYVFRCVEMNLLRGFEVKLTVGESWLTFDRQETRDRILQLTEVR
jgi:hypothetical protein